ncbi:hypothetical protein [Flavobacterium sp. 7A]|uniref:hypothetical protein n=1 Tax=Flavobacterium sp. 7A TaxID=2940571 RepID=UPI0022274474|nr:hypothetical protein [Flavobacterium sp. 7A]MCW2117799.1 hypothetical protein [Flavobacterium sp. 7A]
MGATHKNDNLILVSFGISALLSSSIFNNREPIQFIKATVFEPKKYLQHIIKNSAINSLMIIIPTVLVLLILQKTKLLLFVPLLFIFPIINMLLKYAYFKNQFIQQIYFVFVIGSCIQIYLAPVILLLLPYLYKKAVTNLQLMHYASN